MIVRHLRSPERRGMTLIELVVVLVVLITLAALLIPKLGFVQQQANTASAAATSEDLMNNLEIFRATSGYYPLRFDSLLTTAGALSPSIWPNPGVGTPYVVGTLGSATDFAAPGSWGMTFGAAFTVVDQDASYITALATTPTLDSNSSFNTVRAFTYSGSDAVATITQANTPGGAVWQAAGFPSTTPFNPSAFTGTYTAPASATGVTLVALGVGPQCAAVGGTMSSPPLQVAQQPPYYGRFVAIFAVYGSASANAGKGAELKLVIDSYQQTIGSNINLYRQAGPTNQ
jgi:prepilin-type N-terminal cleavage/methylation domain-containing protein